MNTESWLEKFISDANFTSQSTRENCQSDGYKALVNITYTDIEKAGKLDELFELYIDLFGNEYQKGYFCPNQKCGAVFPRINGHLDSENKIECTCGTYLVNYYDKEELKNWYESDKDFRFNLILDESNKLIAFTCGKPINGQIKDALLGTSYQIYQITNKDIANAQYEIYRYFDESLEGLNEPVYFADSGGVIKSKRNNISALVKSTKPLFDLAYKYTNKRIVCINYPNSTMYKINLTLGFDVIYTAGELVYMGTKDISAAYTLYNNYSASEIFSVFKQYMKSNNRK